MRSPFISIIIPTLNEMDYLPRLLADLAKQKQDDFEVIVVDGMSVDKTQEVALAYANKVPLRIVQSEKRNLCYQRNLGAEKAAGEFFIFLDADSRVGVNFIKSVKKELIKNRFLIFLPTLVPEKGNYADVVLFKFANFFIEASQTVGKPIPSMGVMIFQSDFFRFLGGFAKSSHQSQKKFFPEDHDILLRASKNGVRAKYLKTVKVRFSLRRVEKEGRLQTYRKYLTSTIQMSLQGKMDKDIFKYEMGGHLYKNSVKRTIQRLNDEPPTDFINQVKKIFEAFK